MKKYRLLKDLPYTKAGMIYSKNELSECINNYRSDILESGAYDFLNSVDIENNPEWFEEVKEEYKVGEYVVIENYSNHIYTAVIAYEDFTDEYLVGESWLKLNQFRKPTQEELNTYFI